MIKHIKHAINLVRHKLRDIGTGTKRSDKWETVEKHFREANPTCACCGTDKSLNVHHCKPFHLFPELELEPSNLITLCMNQGKWCHLYIGHCGSFSKWNKNVRIDAATVLANPSKYDEVITLAKKNASPN
jgi:hypothetical protein